MTEEQTPTAQQPTPEEMAKLQEVGEAGASAAAEGKDINEAMKAKRDENGLKMSDEDLAQVSEQLFGKLANLFDERGLMDAPIEPVKPPEQPTAPPAPTPAGAAEQVPAPVAPAPTKRNAAQRFLGVD